MSRVKSNTAPIQYKHKTRLWFESREHFDNAKRIVAITGLTMDDFVRHAVERELNRTSDLIRQSILAQQAQSDSAAQQSKEQATEQPAESQEVANDQPK